jgi:acetylornithine deacetylase/succinyl-diaminopimelate desuccinylase family protein
MLDKVLRETLGKIVRSSSSDRESFLAELVKMPSDNPPGDCAPFAAHAAILLEGLGFTVERHAVPETTVRANGMISATNLIVRHSFGPGPTIALNAHGDVVAPGGGWSVNPYGAVVKDGWMYGRGAAVSKSDIATYAFALKALIASGAKLAGTVEIHVTMDEEVGGALGPRWLIEQGLTKPDYAICAGFSYAVVAAHNGCLHLEVTVEGKSAHAADPSSGIDALAGAVSIMTALYRLREDYSRKPSKVPGIGAPNLNIGLISGGINTNVVPDSVRFTLDRRIVPEEDPAQVEIDLHLAIEQATKPGTRVAIRRMLLARPLTSTPTQAPLLAAVQSAARAVFGEDIPALGVPLYTDARHYAEAGIPVVLYGAGPRTILEANAHRADERLPLADLHRATETIAIALADLLQAQS